MAGLFSLMLCLQERPKPTQEEHVSGALLKGWLQALLANIYTMLERDKHASLFVSFIIYDEKFVLGPRP
jgi:hypothetical protein